MNSRLGRTLVVSLLALSPAAVQAGSPLTCFPMPIGDARSLAWGSGNGWNTPRLPRLRSRAAHRGHGSPPRPPDPRPRPWRRCGARWSARNDGAATGLFEALRGRAGATSGGKADPLAQFDLGYAVAAWGRRQGMAEGDVPAVAPWKTATRSSARRSARAAPIRRSSTRGRRR